MSLSKTNLAKLPPAILQVRINGEQYKLYTVPKDGHCMFHAINLAINGMTQYTTVVRRQICHNVIQNWSKCEDLILVNHPNIKSIQDYYSTMIMGNGWGSAVELKAAGMLYGVNFKVWVQGQDANKHTTFFCETYNLSDQVPTINLLLAHNHYNLVVPLHPENTPTKQNTPHGAHIDNRPPKQVPQNESKGASNQDDTQNSNSKGDKSKTSMGKDVVGRGMSKPACNKQTEKTSDKAANKSTNMGRSTTQSKPPNSKQNTSNKRKATDANQQRSNPNAKTNHGNGGKGHKMSKDNNSHQTKPNQRTANNPEHYQNGRQIISNNIERNQNEPNVSLSLSGEIAPPNKSNQNPSNKRKAQDAKQQQSNPNNKTDHGYGKKRSKKSKDDHSYPVESPNHNTNRNIEVPNQTTTETSEQQYANTEFPNQSTVDISDQLQNDTQTNPEIGQNRSNVPIISSPEVLNTCRKLGIEYENASLDETKPETKNRKRRNERHIKKTQQLLQTDARSLPEPAPITGNEQFDKAMDCIRAFELEQMSYNVNTCNVCNECRVENQMQNPNTCKRCHSEKPKFQDIKMFSKENNMDPGQLPAEMADLTTIEQQLIARIYPCMNIHLLKHGGIASSGHCVSFMQNIDEPAKVFPRLPKEVSIIKLRRPGQSASSKDFRVRRYKVQEALFWLKENNPVYKDIEISEDRLLQLPEDGECEDIVTIECNNNTHNKDLGPAPQQVPDDVEGETNSGVLLPDETVRIRDKVDEAVREAISTSKRKNQATLSWPTKDNSPVPEYTTSHFFTMAFPALFPHATADFFSNRPSTCDSLPAWADHLLWYRDGRFARHRYFKFVIHNMIMRKRASEQGSFIVRQQLGEGHISVEDLREKIEMGDNSTAEKILYFSAQLRGTTQYWGKCKKELRALTQYKINRHEGLPSIFTTGSCAEFHFKPLRILISQYIKETGGEEVNLENRNEMFKALQDHAHIVAKYFDLRTTSYFEKVMKPLFKIDTFWYRQEFAKSRGMVHWHGLCWRSDREPHSLIQQAVEEGLSDPEVAERLAKWATAEYGMTANHPAGKDEDGNSRKELWPRPEGTAPPPPEESNPLMKLLMDVSESEESLMDDYLLLSNRFNLHRCSDYCLRLPKNGSTKKCRMEFGTEENPGKELRNEPAVVKDKNGQIRLEMPRDHPVLTQHSRYHTQGWRANGDISLILSRGNVDNPSVNDIIAVERYITGYACKGNEGTGAMVDIFAEMVKNADLDNGDSARSLVSKLLMRTTKRDVSATEAVFELSGIPLYRCSHTFQTIGLTGARVLERGGATLTKSTVLDRYLSRHTEDKSSLYEFASKGQKVPVVPGNAKAVWPLTEDYCRTMLLIHWPNWRQISDIKETDSTWTDKFEEFLAMDTCPHFVKADVEQAKCDLPAFDYNGQGEDEEYDQEDWMENMRPATEFDQDTFKYDDGGEEYDWAATAYQLPTKTEDWTASLPERLKQAPNVLEIPDVDVTKLNKEQHFAYLMVMNSLRLYTSSSEGFQPLRMVVAGTAGSGKSFLIKCLVKTIRLMFQTNECVQVLCPTGNSANVISGVTLHSFLKVPTTNKTKDMSIPDGKVGEILQQNCDGLKVLLVDERSMVGANTLGWMEWMAQCGSACGTQSTHSWGGIPVVVFFGDDVQLPPVLDSPVYHCKSKAPASLHGVMVWKEFDTAVTLTSIIRQSAKEKQLKDALGALREYKLTLDQAHWLQGFQWNRLRESHGQELLDRMHKDGFFVFPTHAEEWEHNKEKLLEANKEQNPIAKCVAVSMGPHAKKTTADNSGGLAHTLYICRTAKVNLSVNLCVPYGLFNGAPGTIKDVLFFDKRKPVDGLPDVVLVEFPGYTGPAFLEDHPKLIPIVPIERRVDCLCRGCKRKQLPLRLGWASTIHRCQGITVGQGQLNRYIVISPGSTAFESRNPGALFVSLSRPKSAGDKNTDPDFAFHGSVYVNEDRLCHRVETAKTYARAKEMAKIAKMSTETEKKYGFLFDQEDLKTFVTDILRKEH